MKETFLIFWFLLNLCFFLPFLSPWLCHCALSNCVNFRFDTIKKTHILFLLLPVNMITVKDNLFELHSFPLRKKNVNLAFMLQKIGFKKVKPTGYMIHAKCFPLNSLIDHCIQDIVMVTFVPQLPQYSFVQIP